MTDTVAILLLAIVDLAGLLMVPLGLPGLWVMILGLLGYGWFTGFQTVGLWTTTLVLALGAVVGVPVGAFVRSFAGAAVFEYTASAHTGAAVAAGWGAMLGRAAAAAAKIALGIGIAVISVIAVLRYIAQTV